MYKHLTLLSAGLLAILWPVDEFEWKTAQLANYRTQSEIGEKTGFYANPLVLNGKPLDYTFFSMSSRGKLAVVAGNPESEEACKIPFRAYLKRDGIMMQESVVTSDPDQQAIELVSVLAMSQPGDELVIEPVRKADAKARRSILLKPMLNWLFPRNTKDNC